MIHARLLREIARLLRVEAAHDPNAVTDCARSPEHETRLTESERRHLFAEAKAIEEEADEAESGDQFGGVFNRLRGKTGG